MGLMLRAVGLVWLGALCLPLVGMAEDEALDANGFPASWKADDFTFTMLEPAAGEVSASVKITPTVPVIPFIPEAAGLAVQPASPSAPQGSSPKSYKITDLPHINVTPSGTMALPAAAGEGLATEGVGSVFRPVGQVLPQHNGGVAADLGIIVNEQALGGKAGGAAALTTYGPLAAGIAAPEDVWSHAPLATQRTRLQAAVAYPLASPALKEAFRRMLLAQVAAPTATEGQPHWLAVRAETLEGLGLYEAAWSLWREAGPLLRQPGTASELQQGWARASLLAGQTEAACSLVREQAAAGMVSDFWPSAAAVCAALELQTSGNPAALALAIQLLPPKTLQNDPALVVALTAVRDDVSATLGQKGGKQWPVGPLAGATLAAAPDLLPTDMLQALPDVALRRIRASTELSPEMRTRAALHLVDKTAWQEDANAWLSMVSSPTLSPRVGAWPDAAVVAWAQQISGTVANPAATTSATVAWGESAPAVVQAALRMGEIEMANAWLPQWHGALTSRSLLQAKMALAVVQRRDVETPLNQWLALPNSNATQSQRVLAVLEGMGHTIAGTTWGKVAGAAGAEDALNLAWQRLLESAAQQRDIPAVLTMVAEALRGQSASSASPAMLRDSLEALRTVGEAKTAARLAAEALTLTPNAAVRALPMQAEAPKGGQSVMTVDAPIAPTKPAVPAPKAPLLPKPNV